MYDLHVHSIYSNDSYAWATLRNICNTAIEKGLKGVCFTDHVDIDYPDNVGILDYEKYSGDIDNVILEFNNKIEIYKGLELGMQPHLSKENSSFSSKPDIDFVLGSIHVVEKRELYKSDFLKGRSNHEGILAYFRDLKNSITSFDDFDSLGHIDVVRRYLIDDESDFEFNLYRDYIADILEHLIPMSKGIEINTSGKRYGLNSFHPSVEILKLYKDLGGEIITIGSDAHRPEDLGHSFMEVLDLLKTLGFRYYCIYRKRKPVFIRID
ncbi:histidinol-phosphatase HisJ family protein [Lutispora thermophila]|uniref:Histidinol-phosphatase n=1 Tax=Lutispora thermophila DSM 19022 TaxID=1122184 RepID=A0A1M6HN86_9FIRM|nr:histidinol-phosphatase HisJ family protein [Lutispora thermophila]SHJ23618.1 histidinol-phosphatase (PHP family) [Lutispora thermophila DSM 19022]